MEYNESDVSLDLYVVFGMERPNAIIKCVRSKVGFHLTDENTKKKRKKVILYL